MEGVANLATTIVGQGETVDHLACILGGSIHAAHARADLARALLGKTTKDGASLTRV
jgi:hypothetical protein